jgi:hypothetical protein
MAKEVLAEKSLAHLLEAASHLVQLPKKHRAAGESLPRSG